MTHFTDFDNIKITLENIGIENPIKITDTLQGSIWRASVPFNAEKVVVKVTNRDKHYRSICVVDNKSYQVKENIILEQHILQFLTKRKDCPLSIVQFRGIHKTNSRFYLVMEDGGYPLFDFIEHSHQLIKDKRIEINEWKKVVKIIFKQLIDCIQYIHSLNICHNDISLENLLINDVNVDILSENKIRFIKNDIHLKICDFGLAEWHLKSDCLSNKHCGKRQYESPEVINEKAMFNGKKNDVWCCGVCLFIMIFGFPPWTMAHISDKRFDYIMNGNMVKTLKLWDVMCYVDKHLIHLFESIFKSEEDRVSLDGIKKHPWYTDS